MKSDNSTNNAAPFPTWKRADIAAHYQVTTRTVASWHAQGKLPFIQINPRCIRYRADDVQRALARIKG